MKSDPQPAAAQTGQLRLRIFAGLFGGFLGLALLKFGNPPIMEKWVSAPAGFYEFLLGYPWPIAWAYGLLVVVGGVGAAVAQRRPGAPRWLIALPLVWLVWQVLAGTGSVDATLSASTVKHFSACVLCFYLGFFSLSRVDRLWPFFLGLLCGFTLVAAIGLDQHFGGLEESRRYFHRQVEFYPLRSDYPPEFLKRIASSRIYATLFYPNTLAGVLLLLLPAMLVAAPSLRDRLQSFSSSRLPTLMTVLGITLACLYLYLLSSRVGWVLLVLLGLTTLFPFPKWALPGLLASEALACLYWSGSKGGWLLMLLLGVIVLLRLPMGKEFKTALVAAVLSAGLAGFFWTHSGFFQKGATSVSARFDYWRAAMQTASDKPVFGTGPGTFFVPYQKIKRPESEMARLVHNDYLEQASDSGIVGFLTYTLFIAGGLVWSFPRSSGDWQTFAVWLGVLGWSLQGFVEFGLYIPALAWPAFGFLGWLLGKNTSATRRNPMDNAQSPR